LPFNKKAGDNLKTKPIPQALAFVLALAVLCPGAHAAPLSLQAASITATYNGAASGMLGLDHDFAAENGSNTATVHPAGDGAEFFTSDFLFGIDFDASGLVTVIANYAVSPGDYRMRFDFGASLASPITAFTWAGSSGASGAPGLSIVDAHTVAFDFNAVDWSEFGSLSAQLGTTAAAAVPEPDGMAIMLTGVAGLALARRARKPRP
jgi:hypothetical protein